MEIIECTSLDQFNTLLTSSPLVLIDFWATWCPPCLMLRNMMTQNQKRFNTDFPDLKICSIELTPENQTWVLKKWKINAIPHLICYVNQEKIDEFKGFMKYEKLAENLRSCQDQPPKETLCAKIRKRRSKTKDQKQP